MSLFLKLFLDMDSKDIVFMFFIFSMNNIFSVVYFFVDVFWDLMIVII